MPVYPELPHQSSKAHYSFSHLWHNDHKSHYKNSKTFQSVPSKFWFTVHTLLAVQKLVIKKVNKLPQLEPWWVTNATVPMDSARKNVKIMVTMNFVRPNKWTFVGVHFTQWSEKATNCHEVILRIQNHRCSVIRVTQICYCKTSWGYRKRWSPLTRTQQWIIRNDLNKFSSWMRADHCGKQFIKCFFFSPAALITVT